MGFIVICIVIYLPILSVLMFVSKTYTVIYHSDNPTAIIQTDLTQISPGFLLSRFSSVVSTGYFKLLQMLFPTINNIFWCSHNWSCGFFLTLTTCKNVSLWGQWLHSWSMVLMDSSYLTTYHIRSYNVYTKINVTYMKILKIIWRMCIFTHHLFEIEFNFNSTSILIIFYYSILDNKYRAWLSDSIFHK